MKLNNSLSVLRYPNEIYNEGEILDVYRQNFPEIVSEFDEIVRMTYCNPLEYRKLVRDKAKKFDILFERIENKYNNSSHTLKSLVAIDITLHKNYAFNFWIVSYAIGEGPLAVHYVNLIEKILKKVYSTDLDKYLRAKEAFLKTDFEIFYHKILVDSVTLREKLEKDTFSREKLVEAKHQSLRRREVLFDQIIDRLKKSKEVDSWTRHILDRHESNPEPIYSLFNQGIDYYQENCELKRGIKEVRKIIRESLVDTQKILGLSESTKLKNIYGLIREMIRAKDFIFGRKDPKLFKFWKKLTTEIVELSKKDLNVTLDSGGRNFLTIPWGLKKHSPEWFQKEK